MRVLHVATPSAAERGDPPAIADGIVWERVVVAGGTPLVLLRAWNLAPPDLVWAGLEPTAASAAWVVSRSLGAPLVLDARGGAPRPTPALRFLAGRAIRVLVASEADRAAALACGVEAGRVLAIAASDVAPNGVAANDNATNDVPTVTGAGAVRLAPGAAGDPARAPSLACALEQVRRLAAGRDVSPRPAGVYAAVRRAADLLVGAGLLVLLAPLLAVVAIAIRLDSPGPVLFRQRRIGRGSSEFRIAKFRTMTVGTPDLASHLMGPGSSRVTRLGRILRRTSLDELPQLWHLVTGEMTLVGPRPALHNQFDLIAMRQALGIDALLPGVTGWAQVNGRDDIPLERKVALDHEYLQRISPGFDLHILVCTAVVLFSDRGVF